MSVCVCVCACIICRSFCLLIYKRVSVCCKWVSVYVCVNVVCVYVNFCEYECVCVCVLVFLWLCLLPGVFNYPGWCDWCSGGSGVLSVC